MCSALALAAMPGVANCQPLAQSTYSDAGMRRVLDERHRGQTTVTLHQAACVPALRSERRQSGRRRSLIAPFRSKAGDPMPPIASRAGGQQCSGRSRSPSAPELTVPDTLQSFGRAPAVATTGRSQG